jgi:hypothetical protein
MAVCFVARDAEKKLRALWFASILSHTCALTDALIVMCEGLRQWPAWPSYLDVFCGELGAYSCFKNATDIDVVFIELNSTTV